jgi:hypothetical protein
MNNYAWPKERFHSFTIMFMVSGGLTTCTEGIEACEKN